MSSRHRLSSLALLFSFALPSAAQQLVPPPDACRLSAQETLQASQRQARADYGFMRAKCTNLPMAQRIQCLSEAQTALQDALELCDDQYTERLDVCNDLGPAVYDPQIVPGNFVSGVNHPFFPLQTGVTLVYEKSTPEGLEHIEVTTTGATKVILGVTCVEVHDFVVLNGVSVEDTIDWFAQDVAGNVWYFGELALNYENGELVDLHGSWRAGVDGAKPGFIMEATPHVGDLYRQEFLVAEAEDLAEVVSLNRRAVVPYGTFNGCLQTEDFTPIEPNVSERKYYAPGVGLVLSVNLVTGLRTELVDIRP
jgi:hypothetical protein